MNIVEKLKALGVEITAEIEKTFGGEFISEKESEKKLAKVQAENETLKERLTTAEETLKGFEGKDFDEITRERDEWKKKAEESEKNHKGQKTRVYLRLGVDKIRPRWYNYFGGKGKTALGEKI